LLSWLSIRLYININKSKNKNKDKLKIIILKVYKVYINNLNSNIFIILESLILLFKVSTL